MPKSEFFKPHNELALLAGGLGLSVAKSLIELVELGFDLQLNLPIEF
jgi:hypothetical protein